MAEAALDDRWTTETVLAWLADGHGGEHRWELVDGQPTMMAPPVARHSIVVGNVAGMLRERLRGGPCRPFTGDFGIETRIDQLRLPDVLVDCGPRHMDESVARDPKVAFEVLSPSTRTFDAVEKMDEYRGVPALAHLVVIDPTRVDVAVWTREGDGWAYERLTDPDASITLAALDVGLPLAEVYEDVTFE